MADSKISELTALTSAASADADEIAVVDTDAVETKKMALSELDTRVLSQVANQASATVATGDLLVINDIDDSNNPKQVTAQSVADLSAVTSHYGNPASTEWQVGWTDLTDPQAISSGIEFTMGPFRIEAVLGGTGVTSTHTNTRTSDNAFGIREFTLPSSAGGFQTWGTDIESIYKGQGTYRVGARVQYPILPASGGEDYDHWVAISSNTSTLPATNAVSLGIQLASNATNFVTKTSDGSTSNVTDTGVAFAINTWYNLELEMTSTAVSAWIDGTKVLDASTTNVPAANTEMSVQPFNARRNGTPSVTRAIYVDWMYIAHKPDSARGTIDSGSGGPWG
jgi:hypothetical protein